MNSQASRSTLIAVAVLLVLGAGAAGKIETMVDPSAPFSSYRTFNLEVSTPDPEQDPTGQRRRLHQVLTESITEEFEKKGLKSTNDQPDLKIVYTGYTGAAAAGGVMTGAGGMRGWRFYDYNVYDQGTLIIEIIDTTTDKSVWRGTIPVALPKDPANIPQKATKAVSKLLRRYPPK